MGHLLYMPVSVGQLLDQIAILEIKAERLRSPEKVANVYKALSLLRDLASEKGIALHGPDYLELAQVNRQLWEVADRIREKERESRFDGEFVGLAHALYHLNDRRSAVKRRLNEVYGSAIVEENRYAGYGEPASRPPEAAPSPSAA